MGLIRCNCGEEISVDFPEVFDTKEYPDLFEEVLEGKFLSVQCSACGTLIKPELPVRLVDKERGVDIFFLPDKEREKYLAGKRDVPEADRIVFGYLELAEKVYIFSNDLNDRVVETIKYYYLKKGGGEDITVYLDALENEKLRFHIHGLKKDEIGITTLSRNFYEKVETELPSIVQTENLSEVLSPPYVSVKKIYIETEEE